MTKRIPLSKPLIILMSIVTALLLGCSVFFSMGFSEASEDYYPPIKATIVFPEDGIATAIWWRDSHANSSSPAVDDLHLWDAFSGTYYPEGIEPKENNGYNIIKPIEEYDNVVSVDNPTANQVIVRETYPVTQNGVIQMHEIIVWGNGSCISRPIT
jgi:hypothetical protein